MGLLRVSNSNLSSILMKKTASIATLLLAATVLTACGADTLDGTYTGTTESDGLPVRFNLTVKDDTCQLSATAPIVGEIPSECAIDQGSQIITIDGEPTDYTVDGDTVMLPLEDGEELALNKI